MVFNNEDELKSYLQKQGIDIISNPSAKVEKNTGIINANCKIVSYSFAN